MFKPVPRKGPLSEAELDELDEFLSSVGATAMNLEEFDGFLTALIVGPEPVMPSEYWPEVLGTEEFEFATTEDAEKIFGMVMRHWNTIATTLDAVEIYEPILLEDEAGLATGKHWGIGFMRGVQLRFEGWESFIDDDETAGLVLPIMMLAHEDDPDPKLRTPTLTDEKRKQVLISTAAALPRIFKLFQAKREPAIVPYKRVEPKVGRNDPCPCSSGKKYKHCCGAASSLH